MFDNILKTTGLVVHNHVDVKIEVAVHWSCECLNLFYI